MVTPLRLHLAATLIVQTVLTSTLSASDISKPLHSIFIQHEFHRPLYRQQINHIRTYWYGIEVLPLTLHPMHSSVIYELYNRMFKPKSQDQHVLNRQHMQS